MSERISQNLTVSLKSVTEKQICNWYKKKIKITWFQKIFCMSRTNKNGCSMQMKLHFFYSWKETKFFQKKRRRMSVEQGALIKRIWLYWELPVLLVKLLYQWLYSIMCCSPATSPPVFKWSMSFQRRQGQIWQNCHAPRSHYSKPLCNYCNLHQKTPKKYW